MLPLHITLFIINDILMVVLKKASDRISYSKCYSNCCECCLGYVEQKSREARERTRSLDAALDTLSTGGKDNSYRPQVKLLPPSK